MKKKLLSILLALCMAITLLPASALADEAADAEVLARLEQFKVASEKTWADVYYLVLRGQGAIGADTLSDSVRSQIMNYLATVEELDLQGPKTYQSSFPDLGVLAPFTGLKTLKVTGAMSGSTAALNIGALANLKNLETVVLSGNNITDIGALANCTAIKSLDLSGNSGLTEFGALEYLTQLKELNLSGTGANNETFGAIQKLSLTSLDLSKTAVSDIGGLTYDPSGVAGANTVKTTLKTLDISNTSVTALDYGLWREDQPVFSQLTTLKAQNLNLNSIAGLANIAGQEDFSAAGITWDLTGSRVSGSDGADQAAAIAEKFGGSGFTAPTTDLPTENALASAESWKAKFATDLGTDGGEASLTWDTLITAIYWYRQAQDYVSNLGSDVSQDAKTEAQTKLNALTQYYNQSVTKLNMSGKTDSKYAISTGALTDFKALEELNLSGTGINDAGGLAELTGLKKLDLSKNAGINNTHFGALTKLELTNLNLSETGVSDIGGLTGGATQNKIAAKLETLDISNTPVTKLESVWKPSEGKGAPTFPALKTLNAQGLALESISGLVEIASADDFNAEGITWNLEGSSLSGPDAKDHIAAIQDKLTGENSTFEEPTVPETLYYISFAGGENATGSMAPVTIPKANTGSTTYSLPACGFTAPSGKTFQNWEVTDPTDQGITIENNTLTIPDTVAAGTTITLTATYRDDTATEYTITSATAQNGSFTVANKAADGDTVTISVTPDTGYMVDQVTVKPTDDAEAESLTVSTNPGGTYSFTMPAKAVTVTLTFKETGAPTTTIRAKFTPSGSLTGTDAQTYFYGKLELEGLKNGSYYLVAFDNGNAKPVSGSTVYPRTCYVVQGNGATYSMICQSGMYVSVYALHAGVGAPYVIPSGFADPDIFGLNKQNVATKVDGLTDFTVLKNYAELP